MGFILPVGRYPVQEKAQRINAGISQVGVILTLLEQRFKSLRILSGLWIPDLEKTQIGGDEANAAIGGAVASIAF